MGVPTPTTTNDAGTSPFYTRLGFQITAGIVLGIALGFIEPKLGMSMKVLGDIFLRLIKTVVAPLVFLNLVLGILAAGDLKKVGKIGFKALIYFEIVSTIVLAISMVLANYSGVGIGMHLQSDAAAQASAQAAYGKAAAPSFDAFLTSMIPDSFVGTLTGHSLLQVVVLAIAFGAAVLMLTAKTRTSVEGAFTTMSECFFKLTDLVMRFAPIGAFGAIAYAIGASGSQALISLGYLLLVMYAILAFVVVGVFGVILRCVGMNIFHFLRYFKSEIGILFATGSSESAFPRLMEKLQALGCSKQTVSLVLPTGYAFNLDGTSVYLPLCVMFLANAYGVPLTWEHQLGLLLIMLVTSKGAATVSGGTFIVFAATVTASGMLPIEGLPLLFGINRFTSQAVCICNAMGNSVATVVVAKLNGDFDEQAARAEYHRALGRPANASL
ncbi:cation:dicarboxylate symporter family transporter [Bordetella genomosp. 13]|uniref:cation:dicarboxylate symporter family transporter n=1 Tax=Bordetella genomosp. 13 TaxID=463040 RepID=UPI00119D826A|nr:cation:dicarboxylase symporter family transporter [Bordetella genomosp. 13]